MKYVLTKITDVICWRFTALTLGIGTTICALTFLFFVASHPVKHYLTTPKDDRNILQAQFEAGYFTYLAGVTIAVIVTLVGIVFADHSFREKRISIGTGIISLVMALSLVTVGYMARNVWVSTGGSLLPVFTKIDLYGLGPATAGCYVAGVVSLIQIAIHAMRIKPEKLNTEKLSDNRET